MRRRPITLAVTGLVAAALALAVTIGLPLATVAAPPGDGATSSAAPTPPVGPAATITDPGMDVGLTDFADLVVDAVHGRVFISQGTGTVVVTSLLGVPETTVTGVYGAQDLALSADGSTVFAAMSQGDGIAAIDTSSLLVTKYSTGVDTCPISVAPDGGSVWFGYTCANQHGSVGRLTLSTGAVTLGLMSLYQPQVMVHPSHPDTLYTYERGLSPATLRRSSVGPGPSLTPQASRQIGSNARAIAFAPDGATIVTASGSPYYHPSYGSDTLDARGSYPTTNYPNAVAIREDGRVAAGVDGSYSDDIFLYAFDTETPLASWELGNNLAPNGLAWGGGRLFAVSGRFNDPRRLHVLVAPGETPPPAPTPGSPSPTPSPTPAPTASPSQSTPIANSSVRVTADRKVFRYGQRARLSLRLATSGSERHVELYRRVAGVAPALVRRVEVGAGEKVTVRPRVTEKTRFILRYPASQTAYGASAGATVKVAAGVRSRMLGHTRRSGKFHVYRYDQDAVILTQVRPNHAGDCARFQWQGFFRGRWRSAPNSSCVVLSPDSLAGFRLRGDARVIGVPFRIRTIVPRTGRNLAGAGPWRYLTYARAGGRALPRSLSADDYAWGTGRALRD